MDAGSVYSETLSEKISFGKGNGGDFNTNTVISPDIWDTIISPTCCSKQIS